MPLVDREDVHCSKAIDAAHVSGKRCGNSQWLCPVFSSVAKRRPGIHLWAGLISAPAPTCRVGRDDPHIRSGLELLQEMPTTSKGPPGVDAYIGPRLRSRHRYMAALCHDPESIRRGINHRAANPANCGQPATGLRWISCRKHGRHPIPGSAAVAAAGGSTARPSHRTSHSGRVADDGERRSWTRGLRASVDPVGRVTAKTWLTRHQRSCLQFVPQVRHRS